MFSRALVLAVFLLAVPVSVGAQDFRADDASENPLEATGSMTFEFYAQASVARAEVGQAFTLEISAIQKWGDAPEPLELNIPGIEAFHIVSDREESKSFNDFRGEPTHDTTYFLEIAPTATGSFTLGPVTASTGSGQLMSSDPIRIEVVAPAVSARAADGVASPAESALPGATAPSRSAGTLRNLLIALGVLSVLLIALYCVLAVSVRPRRSSEVVVAPDMPISDLPDTIAGEGELFARLSARYGRDVRSLTTREIASLEPDPEDRVRVTMLLDQVRASRYADRQP